MKTNLLLPLSFVLLLFNSYSQELTKTLSEKDFGLLHCENTMKVNIETQDTVWIVGLDFQNKEYSHIVDIGYIGIYYTGNKATFIEDLEKIIPYMDEKEIGLKVGRYLQIYDFDTSLYITAEDGEYTTITKQEAIDLAEYLKTAKVKSKWDK